MTKIIQDDSVSPLLMERIQCMRDVNNFLSERIEVLAGDYDFCCTSESSSSSSTSSSSSSSSSSSEPSSSSSSSTSSSSSSSSIENDCPDCNLICGFDFEITYPSAAPKLYQMVKRNPKVLTANEEAFVENVHISGAATLEDAQNMCFYDAVVENPEHDQLRLVWLRRLNTGAANFGTMYLYWNDEPDTERPITMFSCELTIDGFAAGGVYLLSSNVVLC